MSEKNASFRHRLLGIKTEYEVLDQAVNFIHNLIHPQLVSIYLYNKNGELELKYSKGYTFDNNIIDELFLASKIGEFASKFVRDSVEPASHDSSYGDINYYKYSEESNINDSIPIKSYEDFLGEFNYDLCIPLDGQNRSYGAIEIINRYLVKQGKKDEIYLSESEINLISERICSCTATAISNIRRDKDRAMIADTSKILIKSGGYENLEEDYIFRSYENAIKPVVETSYTAFKACILRVLNPRNQHLEIAAKSGTDETIKWSKRVDLPKKIGEGLSGKVFENQIPIFREINKNNIEEFKNHEWVKENKFLSFGCFPLITKDKSVGTLSVFSVYNFNFFDSTKDFFDIITSNLASFAYRINTEKFVNELKALNQLCSLDSKVDASEVMKKFQVFSKRWKSETRSKSDVNQFTDNIYYQRIIGLGPAVIPLLLHDLNQESPAHWFWALKSITGVDPVPNNDVGNIRKMSKAWLDWGKENNYVY